LDIVIHDDRFPAIKLALGVSMFLAEGIASAIEVKSHLDKEGLEHALQVCASLVQSDMIDTDAKVIQRIEEFASNHKITIEESCLRISAMMVPKSFIYAFNSSLSEELFLDTIWAWVQSLKRVGILSLDYQGLLWRVISWPCSMMSI